MEIKIDIPDWVKEENRGIYIMAGIELVAYKLPFEEKWKVKTGRCNMCGKCCMNFGEVTGELKEMVTETGRCKYLISDGDKLVCSLSSARPWSCSVEVNLKDVPECTEKFKEI